MIDPNKPSRAVSIADHIWNTFEDMASQMGSDRDALINQAMFMFARLNGFLETGPARGAAAAPAPARDRAPSAVAPAQARNGPAVPPLLKPASAPPPPQQGSMDDDPGRRAVADRVLQTAAELERLIKAKNQPPPPVSEPSLDVAPEADAGNDDGGVDLDPSSENAAGNALYMQVDGGELDRIAKDRFVIGRGKHCDFVVNSGKVSREHAVVIHEGSDFFIEDLGSSNGTWFNKQRIKRRRIEDGDEYFICSEKVKFVFR